MVYGLLHPGSGLGDQLFSYILTRVTARRLKTKFGFIGDFKGKEFMQLDMGDQVFLKHYVDYPAGKIIIAEPHKLYEVKTHYFDPESQFIEEDTVIDGCLAQDTKYFENAPLDTWLKVEPKEMPDNLCILNLRGGEFKFVPDLFLPKSYWEEAIKRMLEIMPDMEFQVHTDDLDLAEQYFPKYIAVKNIGENWRSVRFAKYSVVSNSAFGIIPSLLNTKSEMTIAPKYWGRRNRGFWSMPANYYSKFIYI